ncbi:hypothetical protein CEXT_82821 [Caerostris extrusa]|uniref:Uncharacterized protein n=1 Tax=Caerostris extrusa TaxID=172846 RepID=A0AAV4VUR8_CAEEX|nr:hypothetical protein CEXT_82821 [Caerostris extrusa]
MIYFRWLHTCSAREKHAEPQNARKTSIVSRPDSFSFLDHCTKYEKKGTFCSKDQKDRYICDPKLKTSIFFYTCEDPDTTTTTTNTPPTESTIEPETSPAE